MTPEIHARLQVLRQKSREGIITKDELREAVEIMREGRVAAAATSAKSAAKRSTAAAKKSINSDDLLGELDGL